MAGFQLSGQLVLSVANLDKVTETIHSRLSAVKGEINLKIAQKSLTNVKALSDNLATLSKSLDEVKTKADLASISLNSLTGKGADLTNMSKHLHKTQNKVSREIHKTGQAAKEGKGYLEDFAHSGFLALKRFAAFTIATSAVFGLVYAFRNAVSEAINFEAQMVKVGQVLDRNVDGVRILAEEVRQLAIQYGVSSARLAEVSQIMSQAGLRGQDLSRGLEAIAKSDLSPTFTNMNKTAEGLIAAFNQFGLESADFEGALGSINAVASRFAVEADDMINAIRRTGSVWSSASEGIGDTNTQLNELLATFTAIRATSRESPERIATGLRTIVTRIQRPRTAEFLEEGFGIDLKDAEGDFIGAYRAIDKLGDALRNLPQRDPRFMQIAEELGGVRRMTQLLPLLTQTERRQDALNVAMEGSNSLTKDAERGMKALSRRLASVGEEWLQLADRIVQTTAFQMMAESALNLSSALITVLDSLRGILPIVAMLGAAKLGGLALGKMGFAGKKVVGQAVGQATSVSSVGGATHQAAAQRVQSGQLPFPLTGVGAHSRTPMSGRRATPGYTGAAFMGQPYPTAARQYRRTGDTYISPPMEDPRPITERTGRVGGLGAVGRGLGAAGRWTQAHPRATTGIGLGIAIAGGMAQRSDNKAVSGLGTIGQFAGGGFMMGGLKGAGIGAAIGLTVVAADALTGSFKTVGEAAEEFGRSLDMTSEEQKRFVSGVAEEGKIQAKRYKEAFDEFMKSMPKDRDLTAPRARLQTDAYGMPIKQEDRQQEEQHLRKVMEGRQKEIRERAGLFIDEGAPLREMQRQRMGTQLEEGKSLDELIAGKSEEQLKSFAFTSEREDAIEFMMALSKISDEQERATMKTKEGAKNIRNMGISIKEASGDAERLQEIADKAKELGDSLKHLSDHFDLASARGERLDDIAQQMYSRAIGGVHTASRINYTSAINPFQHAGALGREGMTQALGGIGVTPDVVEGHSQFAKVLLEGPGEDEQQQKNYNEALGVAVKAQEQVNRQIERQVEFANRRTELQRRLTQQDVSLMRQKWEHHDTKRELFGGEQTSVGEALQRRTQTLARLTSDTGDTDEAEVMRLIREADALQLGDDLKHILGGETLDLQHRRSTLEQQLAGGDTSVLQELTDVSNQLQENTMALEYLSQDTEALTAIQNEIHKAQQQREAGRGLMGELMGMDTGQQMGLLQDLMASAGTMLSPEARDRVGMGDMDEFDLQRATRGVDFAGRYVSGTHGVAGERAVDKMQAGIAREQSKLWGVEDVDFLEGARTRKPEAIERRGFLEEGRPTRVTGGTQQERELAGTFNQATKQMRDAAEVLRDMAKFTRTETLQAQEHAVAESSTLLEKQIGVLNKTLEGLHIPETINHQVNLSDLNVRFANSDSLTEHIGQEIAQQVAQAMENQIAHVINPQTGELIG